MSEINVIPNESNTIPKESNKIKLKIKDNISIKFSKLLDDFNNLKTRFPFLNEKLNDIYNGISRSISYRYDTAIFLYQGEILKGREIIFGYMDNCEFHGIIYSGNFSVNLDEIRHYIIQPEYIEVWYCESSCPELDSIAEKSHIYQDYVGLNDPDTVLSRFALPHKNYPAWFDQMANWLINYVQLIIKNQVYHIAEIEFYVYDPENHKDTCVHQSVEQMTTFGKWYFHREKSAKIGFTLKGLDITIGKGGILIRSIKRTSDLKIIEGPSKTVDEILTVNNVTSVTELKQLPNSLPRIETRPENDCVHEHKDI